MRGYFVPDPKGGEQATPQGPREEGPPTRVGQEAQGGGGCGGSPPGVFMGRTGEAGEAA